MSQSFQQKKIDTFDVLTFIQMRAILMTTKVGKIATKFLTH